MPSRRTWQVCQVIYEVFNCEPLQCNRKLPARGTKSGDPSSTTDLNGSEGEYLVGSLLVPIFVLHVCQMKRRELFSARCRALPDHAKWPQRSVGHGPLSTQHGCSRLIFAVCSLRCTRILCIHEQNLGFFFFFKSMRFAHRGHPDCGKKRVPKIK